MIWIGISVVGLAIGGMAFCIVRGLSSRERVVFASQCFVCAMLGAGCFVATELYQLELWMSAVLFAGISPALMAPGFYMRYEKGR